MIKAATELKLVGDQTAKQADLARDYRNLIHPAVAVRRKWSLTARLRSVRSPEWTWLPQISNVVSDQANRDVANRIAAQPQRAHAFRKMRSSINSQTDGV